MNFIKKIFAFIFDVHKNMAPKMSKINYAELMPYGIVLLAAIMSVLVLRACKRIRRVEVPQNAPIRNAPARNVVPEVQPVRRSQRLMNRRNARNNNN